MPALQIDGHCFERVEDFLAYLEGVSFNAWRPRFITMHHTGAPDLKTWQGWQTRSTPVTDQRWLQNLARYYGVDMGWSAGPQFFFTPKHYCILTPANRRGVHAVSFNATSWGVECVGDFDREAFSGPLRERYLRGLAALHIAGGFQPTPFVQGSRGLHFHRDDPRTTKSCPGRKVGKADIVPEIVRMMAEMSGGDHVDEHVVEEPAVSAAQTVTVKIDDLNMRGAASAKAPILKSLDAGTKLAVLGSGMNGTTRWLNVRDPEGETGWVAAAYTT
jgi:hypothetical protein